MRSPTDPWMKIYTHDLQRHGCKNRSDSGSPRAHLIPLFLIRLPFKSSKILLSCHTSIGNAPPFDFVPSVSSQRDSFIILVWSLTRFTHTDNGLVTSVCLCVNPLPSHTLLPFPLPCPLQTPPCSRLSLALTNWTSLTSARAHIFESGASAVYSGALRGKSRGLLPGMSVGRKEGGKEEGQGM